MAAEKRIDEGWKEKVESEKGQGSEDEAQTGQTQADTLGGSNPESGQEQPGEMEIDFINYVTSLGFQTMIFLGMIPNPLTNQVDKNFKQAKFLIDTLSMLKDKTMGNLSKEEDELLNASLYELQMKYVELSQSQPEADAKE